MLKYLKTIFLKKISKNKTINTSPLVNEMIKRIPSLIKLTVREIMIPRIDITSISYQSKIEDIIKIIKKDGHSRFPVWNKSVDDIMGILHAKDLFPYFFQSQPNFKMRSVLRRAHFVPESKKALELLREFQIKKNHLAMVVDEHGGLSGIVALEDILEEIVGDIQDEYDKDEEEWIIKISKNIYMLDSRTDIQELNETLNLNFNTEKADTIGGFVFELFGHMPEVNEIINYKKFKFQVEKLEGNRIIQIKMKINTTKELEENKTEFSHNKI